mmetsp:Transcript_65444/g.128986  ORF Transcript_65444/g.128986 Transcript_65444/m.128986 type:complete len:209 (-) Transcript_65444:405-1031(-)
MCCTCRSRPRRSVCARRRSDSSSSISLSLSALSSSCTRARSENALVTVLSETMISSRAWLSCRSTPWHFVRQLLSSAPAFCESSRELTAASSSSVRTCSNSCRRWSACRSKRNRTTCASSRSPLYRSRSTLCVAFCRSTASDSQVFCRSKSSTWAFKSTVDCSLRRSLSSVSLTIRACDSRRLSSSLPGTKFFMASNSVLNFPSNLST